MKGCKSGVFCHGIFLVQSLEIFIENSRLMIGNSMAKRATFPAFYLVEFIYNLILCCLLLKSLLVFITVISLLM